MSESNPGTHEAVHCSPLNWVASLYSHRALDTALGDFNPCETPINAIVEGRSLIEQLDAEHSSDPAVQLKNRLLGLLATLSDADGYHVGDMLALMERQAHEMNPPEETRYRQFMGLWDFAVTLSKNEDLLEELRNQSIIISPDC